MTRRVARPALGAVLLFCAASTARAQDAQAPVFRSSVDLLEVDVNIVDGNGRPIADLRTPEFSVSVDGQTRKVVSSEYIADAGAQSSTVAAAKKEDPYVASNTDSPRGRPIIIVVDQNNITSGRARDLIVSVRKFVERLPAADRVALVAIPSPGPSVDFTGNRPRIYQALAGIRGTEDTNTERHDVGDFEADAMFNRGDEAVIRRLIDRECPNSDPGCISDVELASTRIVQRNRTRANESFYALTTLLNNLRTVEGTKSLVLLSQGFLLDDVPGKTSALAQTAAEARVDLNVMLLDDVVGDASGSGRSATLREDREMREQGLDSLAGKSRGALFRVTASPEIAFDRLTMEMSGHYLLGVEPTQKDRDGKTHRIRVRVKRARATVRARQEFRYASRAADMRAREDQVVSLLTSPAIATELPMRMATYVFQDPESYKEKVLVAAEIDPSSAGTADLVLAYGLFDSQGRPVNSARERKIYTLSGAQSVQYDWAMTVQPGTYTIRFGAIDAAGHQGSLEHEIRVWQLSGPSVTVGDLMLGRVDPVTKGGALQPVVATRINNGQIAVYTEFYSSRPEALDGVTVMMEVADTEDSPALLHAMADVAPRVEGAGRQAAVVMPVSALPPGRYFARAVVSAGGQVVGKVARPFEVVAR
jgi:VWFA-related protein